MSIARAKISTLSSPAARCFMAYVMAYVALAGLAGLPALARGDDDRPAADATVQITQITPASRIVRLATTTSTDNSGLLAHLIPRFEGVSGYAVRVISVGTGRAMRLGEVGDVDALLVHAPRSERRFIAAGHGVHRKTIMANDFIIAGPPTDPAGLRQADSAATAFAHLHRAGSDFVSRGDDSGTHKKELELWAAAGFAKPPRRLEVGQGMGKSLQIADELRAYLLIDRATWLFLRRKTTLALLYEGDPALRNPYGAMAVNPRRHAVNFRGATAFIDWLASPAGQTAIGDYRLDRARLFTPARELGAWSTGAWPD